MATRDESTPPTIAYARLDYLFRLGVFVVGVAVVATTFVRGIAGAFGLVPPGFAPLWWSQVIGVTVVGSAGGVFTYALLDRYTTHTARNFVLVAGVVLALSTAPLWVAGRMEGATTGGVLVLGVMHLIVAVVTVGLLLWIDGGDELSASADAEQR